MAIYPAPTDFHGRPGNQTPGLQAVPAQSAGGGAPVPSHYMDANGASYMSPDSQTLYQGSGSISSAPPKRISERILETAPDDGFQSPIQYLKALNQALNQTAQEQNINIQSQEGKQWFQAMQAQGKAEMPTFIKSVNKDDFIKLNDSLWDARNNKMAHTSPELQIASDYLQNMKGGGSTTQAKLTQPQQRQERIPPELTATVPMLQKLQEERDKANKTRNGELSPEQSQQAEHIAKSLTEYKLPPPTGSSLRNPVMIAAIEKAADLDPSFDASQYAVRQKLKQDYTSGKSANNIRSLNTAIGHLATLKEKGAALDNSDVPLWNLIKNQGLSHTGDKRVTGFNNAATAVESELAAVFKGMGATDQEIKQWRKNLDSAGSPDQINEGINTAFQLMGSRLDALKSQYENGLGKPKDFQFLNDKSRKILESLGVNPDDMDGVAGAPAQGDAPIDVSGFSKEEFAKLPVGTRFTHNGKAGTKHK